MTQDDSQILSAIDYTAERDDRIKADIEKAIYSHDRVFFEEIVLAVLNRLHRKVKDLRRFMDTAYDWFRSKF